LCNFYLIMLKWLCNLIDVEQMFFFNHMNTKLCTLKSYFSNHFPCKLQNHNLKVSWYSYKLLKYGKVFFVWIYLCIHLYTWRKRRYMTENCNLQFFENFHTSLYFSKVFTFFLLFWRRFFLFCKKNKMVREIRNNALLVTLASP